jgi:hypothetical protein
VHDAGGRVRAARGGQRVDDEVDRAAHVASDGGDGLLLDVMAEKASPLMFPA